MCNENGNAVVVPTAEEGGGGLKRKPSRMGGGGGEPGCGGRHRTAAEKSEANLAVILVSTVTMFLICHVPRMFHSL